MRVLLVRPGQQGEASARRLVLRGHAPLAVPLLTVQPVGASPPPEMPDALLVTSQNAAQALAGEAGRLGAVPVYAVGAATARAVTRAGYASVHRSGGDGAALARQVAAALPRGARLLHVAGRDRRAEPERSLTRAGFAVSVWEAYAAEPAPMLPEIVAAALADGRLDAVLHYSRRSAETLVRLAHEAGLTEPLRALAHLCLSREVARGLDALSPPALRVSHEPTEEALFSALDRLSAKSDATQARAEPAPDATQGTNPAARHSRTVKDDPPSMSETRRQDPLRRAPPTIDLKAEEVGAGGTSPETKPAAPDAKAAAAEAGATAVEPVATTGLGSDPFPTKSTPPDVTAATATTSAPKGSDVKPTAKPPAPPAPGGSAARSATTPPPAAMSTTPSSSTGGAKAPTATAAKPDPVKSDAKPVTDAEPATGSVPPTGKAGGALGTAAGAAASAAAADTIARSGPATPSSSATSIPKSPAPPLPDSAFRAGDGAPPPPKAKAGIGGLLTAGLLGGVAGAAVAAVLMQALPSRTDTATSERLAAVERRLASAPAGNPAGALEPRIAALEAGLRQAGDEARAARASADAAAKQATEAAGRPLPAAAAPDPGLRPALDALSAKVDEGGKRSEANASAIRDLGTKLGEGLAAGTAAVAALDSSLRGVQTDLGTVKTATGTLETRSAESVRRLDALTGQVTGLSGDLAKLSPAASQAGLRLVVSGRLDEALRTGTPLGPVTAALERLGVEAGLLAPLKPYADVAPPLPAALAAEFKPLAASLTTEPVASAESVGEKVKRLFGKVVTVRAVGDGSGTDVPGLVARIESALARGAVGEAAAAWNQLPESARRATADWAASLKARAAAEDGARRIGSQSLAALDTVAAPGAVARPAPSR